MANQFYYQIVDNTLYYGANQWEGATLLSRYNNNYTFHLYNLSFTSMVPHDDSIVVVENIDSNYLFRIKPGTYITLDFTHFTIKDSSYYLFSFDGIMTVDELGLPDGIETCGTFWPAQFKINIRIFSTKYEDNYIPDMYYIRSTSFAPNAVGTNYYGIRLGPNVKNLSIGYIPLTNIGGIYAGEDYLSYFIYGEGLTSLEFRTNIIWPTFDSNNQQLCCIYTSVKDLDLSKLFIRYGSRYRSSVICNILGDNLKIPNCWGLIEPYSTYNFVNNYQNVELGNLFNLKNSSYMFSSNTNLKTVKLGGTNNLTASTNMFYNCSALTNIYASELWSENLTSSSNMFYNCISLVGGNGTAYNSSKIDASMAHVDRNGQEGYFTYNKATDYYKVILPQFMDSININYPYTQFSKGDNVSITFTGYSKDTTLDYWLQYDPTTKRYKNIGSQNPLNFEILSDTALIPIVKKGTPSAVYNVDLTAVPSNSCTLTGAGAYTAGDNVIITASPNEGYIFKQWEELINDTWIVLSDNKIFTIEAIGRDRTIRAVCVEDSPEVGVTLTLTDDGNGTTFGAGRYLKGTKAEAAASANAGYKFVKWINESGETISANKVYTFIINEDTTLQAIFAKDPYYNGGSSGTGGGDGNFDDTSDIVGGTGDSFSNAMGYTGGLFTAFVLSNDDVTNFKNYMYNTDLINSMKSIIDQIGSLGGEVSDYILNFMKLPVSIQATNTKDVKIGFYPSNLNFHYADAIGMQKGMGSLKIEPYWGNALDYKSKIQIYLPYIGYEYLDTAEVMGKTIGIKYNISFIDGSCVALIYVDDNLKYQFNGNCATNLPISQVNMTEVTQKALSLGASVITAGATSEASLNALTAGNATANIGTPEAQQFASSQINKGNQLANKTGDSIQNAMSNIGGNVRRCSNLSGNLGFLSSQTPYLIISRPRLCMPDNYGHYHGYPSNITRKLGELSGYTVVSNIHLDGLDATSSEIEELESILKSGIIIK